MPVKVIVRKQEYEVPEGITVKQAVQQVGLNPESYLALRNGEMVVETDLLREGDVVKLVAVISGGGGPE